MSNRRDVYSAFETEASLCVYEWLMEHNDETQSDERSKTTVKLFSNYGYSAMRFIAMQAGCIIVELYNFCEVTGGYEHLVGDDSSFDWDFAPMVCNHLNWEALAENNQYGPGDWAPEPAEFLAIIIAKRALDVAA